MSERMIIKNAKQLLTMCGDSTGNVGLVENAWIYVNGGVIEKVGTKEDVEPLIKSGNETCTVIDASGKIVLPGFIDSHTHTVFGGSRVHEYIASITKDNSKIEALGLKTGIYATIDMTKPLPVEELVRQSEKRIVNMLLTGTTTLESKSGYCLDTDGELKMLEANKILASKLPVDIYSTFLGAHGWPKLEMSKQSYIDKLTSEMIPKAAEQGIAQFCDIWCDDGYYTAEESRIVLECGRKYGLEAKIHTDAYSYIGGSDLAAEMKMISADHLNYTPDEAAKKLIDAGVIGTVLPAIEFAVNHPVPVNIRKLLDMGMTLAVATNCCPGCWLESMHFALVLAVRSYGMTPEEALFAATVGGAKALGLTDRGRITAGMKADIQIWDTDTYDDLFYKYYFNPIDMVIKNGKISVKDGILI